MSQFNKFNLFTFDLGQGIHNFSTATLKVMLTDVAPVATNHVKADITEIAAGHGYSAGGTTVTATWSSTGGVAKLTLGDIVFTASGGSIGPFRYAVLYNSSAPSGNLIGWSDSFNEITLAAGQTETIHFDATNGNIQAA